MRAVSIMCKCESMCAAMAISNGAKAQGVCESESVCSKGVCKCKCECKCLCKCSDSGQRQHRVKGTAEDGEDSDSKLCTCLSGWESLLSGVPRRVVGCMRAEEDGGDLQASVQQHGRRCNVQPGLNMRCTSASYARPTLTPTTREVLTAYLLTHLIRKAHHYRPRCSQHSQ